MSRFCADGRRALVALGLSIVMPFVLQFVLVLFEPDVEIAGAANVALTLIGWSTFALTYVVFTVLVFARVDAVQFETRLAARSSGRARGRRRVVPRGDGPSFAIEASVVAFVVVLLLPHIEEIRLTEWLLVTLTLTILVSSWALTVVSYTLHYAQRDREQPGFDFPGERVNAFSDYFYFSIGVATTLGATDVNVTTPAMRRVVNLHAIITFAYNSVIVALLASLLIR